MSTRSETFVQFETQRNILDAMKNYEKYFIDASMSNFWTLLKLIEKPLKHYCLLFIHIFGINTFTQ